LKVGARVIFIRNDRYRRWVNGTTGVVTSLADQEIEVTIASDETITVAPNTWTKTRRVKAGKEISNEEVGSMSQFPLRLGWAITIHNPKA
jgi:ATP-dependent exoDNAse (exonuclease V) alpha subunit